MEDERNPTLSSGESSTDNVNGAPRKRPIDTVHSPQNQPRNRPSLTTTMQQGQSSLYINLFEEIR